MPAPAPKARAGYRIRQARADEVIPIQEIDLAAAGMFEGLGLIDFGPAGRPVDPIPESALRRALSSRLLFVAADACDAPAGFALCSVRGRDLYLDQVSVHPASTRAGSDPCS